MRENELERFSVQKLSKSELTQTNGGGWLGDLVNGALEWLASLRIYFF
jgi:hypothetical protein